MVKLIKPSIKYRMSFLGAIKEFQKEGRNQDINLEQLKKESFSKFAKRLRNREKGLDLPKGYVPESVYWLVDHNKFIGQISLRHKLIPSLNRIGGHIGYRIRPSQRKKGYGTKILALVLPKARKLGLRKVLLTCNESNTGSRKIIEKNGGVFESKIREKNGNIKLRYWISIK